MEYLSTLQWIFTGKIIIKIKQKKTHEGPKNKIKWEAKHKFINVYTGSKQ